MSTFQSKTSQEQQAEAWRDICSVLDEVDPGWLSRPFSGVECARFAILRLAGKAKMLDKTLSSLNP